MTVDKKTTLESQALSAIHEEVLKLLAEALPPNIQGRIELIESICRYGDDVRSEQEKGH